MKTTTTLLSLALAGNLSAFTAALQIDNQSFFGSTFTINNQTGQPIDSGLVELGIFTGTGADTSALLGTWTPLGSFNFGTGGEAGHYTGRIELDSETSPYEAGAQVALRFTDRNGNFNTVTNPNNLEWTLQGDPGNGGDPLPRNINLAGPDFPPVVSDDLVWEDASSPFATTIPVPEPSSLVLSSLGACLLLGRRKRS